MPRKHHHRTPTVSEAVRDGAAIVDPGDADDAIMALYEIYEDDDRPVTAVEDLAGTLVATAEGIDPEGDDGAVLAAAAAAAWVGMNPRDRNEDHESTTSCARACAWPSAKSRRRSAITSAAAESPLGRPSRSGTGAAPPLCTSRWTGALPLIRRPPGQMVRGLFAQGWNSISLKPFASKKEIVGLPSRPTMWP